MAFTTVALVTNLSKKRHRRAARIGPRSVSSNRSPAELMVAAGFHDVDAVDVTRDFDRTARAWHRGYTEHERELRPILGDELDQVCKNRTDLIAGIEEGLLQRVIVSGLRP